MDALTTLENHRIELQSELDTTKTKAERNKLGQFATPTQLATLIIEQSKHLFPENRAVRFLDPALGTGAFYSALLRIFPNEIIETALGYEIDPHYGEEAKLLWRNHPLNIILDDFTKAKPPEKEADRYNLIICNPPYVRHHHLEADEKKRMHDQAMKYTSAKLSGLSGLYAYFLCIAHAWLQEDGIAGWLIPSEFMNVNYGEVIRRYLTSEVTMLDIHRFDPKEGQFDDALVSSTIVWLRKHKPQQNHQVRFSLGGSLSQPNQCQNISIQELQREQKWTRFPKHGVRLAENKSTMRFRDLFDIKRGIATGANHFFILNSEQIQRYSLPFEFFVPILPSPRYLKTDEVVGDENGKPVLQMNQFLLNCDLPENQITQDYPTLWRYLEMGKNQGINKQYLCAHRPMWYAQDKRKPSLFLCTYMGRQSDGQSDNPFRFILNHSRALAPNVYLNIYPKPSLASLIAEKPELKQVIWQSLKKIPVERLLGDGRVYGGGLYKIEPKELSNLIIDDIFDPANEIVLIRPKQKLLF